MKVYYSYVREDTSVPFFHYSDQHFEIKGGNPENPGDNKLQQLPRTFSISEDQSIFTVEMTVEGPCSETNTNWVLYRLAHAEAFPGYIRARAKYHLDNNQFVLVAYSEDDGSNKHYCWNTQQFLEKTGKQIPAELVL